MPRVSKPVEPGTVFGRLTFIKELDPYVNLKGKSARKILCVCSCPEKVIKEYRLTNVMKGSSTSCGCFYVENNKIKAVTHGLSKNPLYAVWKAMLSRCYNPKNKDYNDYGGRGITVYSKWIPDPEGLVLFVKWSEANGYRKGLEIDREDNNKNYSPKNCRFVTVSKNRSNKRNTAYVTYKGKKYIYKDFWRKFKANNVSYITAYSRYKRGMSPLRSVQKPIKGTIANAIL